MAAAVAVLVGVLAAGCSSSPAPETAPAPVMTPAESAAVRAPMLAPAAVSGTYRLRTEIQRQGGPPRHGRTPAETRLLLSSSPSATPQMGAPAATFNATVQIPGYTQAPRGRSGQAAAWWPIPGDSVVVQFARQNGDYVQLRGKKEGTALRGDVWYLAMESGATFQLGTFSAARQSGR